MVGTKNNRRSQMTKKIIQQEFLQLLQNKELSVITITEIAKAADINRGTFYKYYIDPSDLMHQIETEFFSDVLQRLNAKQPDFNTWLENLLAIFVENRQLATIILLNQTKEQNFNLLLEEIKPSSIARFAAVFGTKNQADLELYFSYFVSGALGCIKTWLLQYPKKNPHEIVQILQSSFPANIAQQLELRN